MPYFVHSREQVPEQGEPHAVKADAIKARSGDQLITFKADYDEQHAWKDRESRRLHGVYPTLPEYTPVPFVTIYAHYAHMAKGKPGSIAYTPDDTFGHEDRQLVLTVGRYLERFGPDIGYSPDEYPGLIAKLKILDMKIIITAVADEIARIYTRGPNSCMSGDKVGGWETHPSRVYAGPDLAVAYLGELDPKGDRSKDVILGRAVVRPDHKKYVRVYGDENVMHAALKAEGYEHDYGCLGGARIHAIPYQGGRGYSMPYIDGDNQWADLSKDGKFFVLADHGDFECTPCSGYVCEHEEFTCNGHEDCDRTVDNDGDMCSRCEDVYWCCEGCDEGSYDRDSAYCTYNGYMCESCYEERSHTCEVCDEHFNTAEWSPRTVRLHANTDLCRDCVDSFVKCEQCDEYKDTVTVDDPVGHGLEACLECREAETLRIAAERKADRIRRRGVVIRTVTAADDLKNPTVAAVGDTTWTAYAVPTSEMIR